MGIERAAGRRWATFTKQYICLGGCKRPQKLVLKSKFKAMFIIFTTTNCRREHGGTSAGEPENLSVEMKASPCYISTINQPLECTERFGFDPLQSPQPGTRHVDALAQAELQAAINAAGEGLMTFSMIRGWTVYRFLRSDADAAED